MTYDQAATTLTSLVASLCARPTAARLQGAWLYQAHDQRSPGQTGEREHYFGGLTYEGASEGGVHELRSSGSSPRPPSEDRDHAQFDGLASLRETLEQRDQSWPLDGRVVVHLTTAARGDAHRPQPCTVCQQREDR